MVKIKRFSFLLLSCIVILLSVLAYVPNRSYDVSADEVNTSYSFNGSDLYYISAYLRRGGSQDDICYCICIKTDIFTNNDTYDVYFTPTITYINGLYDAPSVVSQRNCSVIPMSIGSINTTSFGTHLNLTNDKGLYGARPIELEPGVNSYFPFCAGIDGQFNGNVIGVNLYCLSGSNMQKVYWDYFQRSVYKCFYIEYFDNNNNKFFLQFYVPSNLTFSSRVYYFANAFTQGDEGLAYDLGYADGLRDNQQNVYNRGFNDGEIVGYSDGKRDGLAENNPYTFLNFFSSIFDAPIQVISGALNFNFLGINLSSFFFSIVTIAVILFVVKLLFK